MQRREIVILACAGLALTYFGLDYFVFSKTVTEEATAAQVQACEEFVEQSRLALMMLTRSPAVTHDLELLGAETWNNAFIRSGLIALNGAQSTMQQEDPLQLISYIGYIEAEGVCWALINGKEYVKNEVLERINLKIIEIKKGYVILRPQDENSSFGSKDEMITVMKKVENELF